MDRMDDTDRRDGEELLSRFHPGRLVALEEHMAQGVLEAMAVGYERMSADAAALLYAAFEKALATQSLTVSLNREDLGLPEDSHLARETALAVRSLLDAPLVVPDEDQEDSFAGWPWVLKVVGDEAALRVVLNEVFGELIQVEN